MRKDRLAHAHAPHTESMPRRVPPRTEAVGRRSWRHPPRRHPNYPTVHGVGRSPPGQIAHPDRDRSCRRHRRDRRDPRREGIFVIPLRWRRQRDAGAFNALVPARRGPKIAEANPLAAELARSQRNNVPLTRRLARAEAIIDIQKKVAALLGIPLASHQRRALTEAVVALAPASGMTAAVCAALELHAPGCNEGAPG